jgi:hypothetical protein
MLFILTFYFSYQERFMNLIFMIFDMQSLLRSECYTNGVLGFHEFFDLIRHLLKLLYIIIISQTPILYIKKKN